MRILIVDDSRSMRMIVRRALRQAGYGAADVAEAENGAQALAAVQAGPPDVVVSDWNMPTMGGYELLQAMNAANLRVPLGFVTSEATRETRDMAAAAGARFFITKPFAPESFQDALDGVFKGATREVFQVRVHDGVATGGFMLPSVQSVADTLGGLLGKPVTGMDWRSGPEAGVPTVSALYHGPASVDFVCVCDLAFAGYTSGALALMADAQVKKAVEAKKLPENLLEMTREVFNVLARLFHDPQGRQPKLGAVVYSPTPLAADAAGVVKGPAATSHMVVNVPGYGKGRLSAYARK